MYVFWVCIYLDVYNYFLKPRNARQWPAVVPPSTQQTNATQNATSLLKILKRCSVNAMDRLRDIPDDCDVAEFDSIVLKGREIKRLLPGACFLGHRWNEWFAHRVDFVVVYRRMAV
jgi:hypothetical protein